jgi:1-deoxy-D-xylulose 5-phosphate reductoisomerase
MNAANEEAVSAFLNERIRLTEIPAVIETVMNDHVNQPAKDIETILDADHEAATPPSHNRRIKPQMHMFRGVHVRVHP